MKEASSTYFDDVFENALTGQLLSIDADMVAAIFNTASLCIILASCLRKLSKAFFRFLNPSSTKADLSALGKLMGHEV